MTDTKDAVVLKKAPTRLKDLAVSTTDMFHVDPRVIQVEPGFNARDFSTPETQAHVEALSVSIAEIGVQEPLTVRFKEGKILLVNGECRLRGTMLAIERGAEIKTVPAIGDTRFSNDEDRVLSLITRNSGKPLSVLEEGNVYKRLLAFGHNQADIARKVGKTPSHVSQILDLLAAPGAVHTMIKAGEVSPTTAMQTLQEHGETAAVDVLKAAVGVAKESGKSKATAKTIRTATGRDKALTPTQVDTLIAALREVIAESEDRKSVKVATDALHAVKVPLKKAAAPVINLDKK